jgi:uncharacterized protein YndB with AHSA1/START domain
MRPVHHTLISSVGAPIERVFSLLASAERMAAWLPFCGGVEAKGPLDKGSRLKVWFGDRTTDFEIVDCSAPNTFGWVERGARAGCKTFFRLDWAGSATTVTIRNVWEPASLAAYVKGKLLKKRDAVRQLDHTLQNLRKEAVKL